jgi:hypothetical protein
LALNRRRFLTESSQANNRTLTASLKPLITYFISQSLRPRLPP